MKAVCPKNPKHKEFITIAHVAEDWLVDEHGNYLGTIQGLETTHEPNPDNIWRCAKCGTRAKVER